MGDNNYTSIRDFHMLVMNESLSQYSDAPTYGLTADNLAYVKSLQKFPTLIANSIFNSIYAFGIVANIVLLVYLVYYKRYKIPVFCVIFSLGVADLGVCIGCLLNYTLITPIIKGPLWLCNVTTAISYISYSTSSYHIALFAVLRFFQLAYPLSSHSKLSTSLLLKTCLAIWILQFIQACVLAGFHKAVNTSSTGAKDAYVCLFTRKQSIQAVWVIIVWCVVPFISTSGFHVAKQVVVVTANVMSETNQAEQGRKQTDSRALAIVIVIYLITIFPYIFQVFRIYVLNVTFDLLEIYLVTIFIQFGYANSAINPWVYLFASESVRSDIRKMIICNNR